MYNTTEATLTLTSIEPDCPTDSDDSCTAQSNSGSFTFTGTLANGTNIALGSGYTLELLWTSDQSYDDIDDDTNSVTSPSFSVVPDDNVSPGSSGLSTGSKAGIAIGVIVLVVLVLLYFWWRWRSKSKSKHEYNGVPRKQRKDEEKADDEEARHEITHGARAVHIQGQPVSSSRKQEAVPTVQPVQQPGLPANTVYNVPNSQTPKGAVATATHHLPGSHMQTGAISMSMHEQQYTNPNFIATAVGAASATAAVAVPGAFQQQLYIDDKTELPANEGARHEIDGNGVSATVNRTELSGVPAIQELPATPITSDRGKNGNIASTVFHFTPNPTYALQTSNCEAVGAVSPVSAGSSGDVSPMTPMTKKPVSRKAVGSGSVLVSAVKPVTGDEAENIQKESPLTTSQDKLAREKSALLRNAKPQIWKMLGGGGPVTEKTNT